MFKETDHEDLHCNIFNENTHHQESHELNECSKFIIIRLNLSSVTTSYTRYKMRIANFNPDKVVIPGIKETFILKSAILHEELEIRNSNLNNNTHFGHYTTLIRDKAKKKWYEISDTNWNSVKFNKYLEDVFVLLLEKK